MDWTELQPDLRLTFLLGDIVRNDTFAEGESRVVFQVLERATTGSWPIQNDFVRVLEDSKKILKSLALDDFANDMTREAIREAINAHKARNPLTHDRWMHLGGEAESWQSAPMLTNRPAFVKPTKRNLTTFLAARDALSHAAWRMRGVSLVLPSWLGMKTLLDQRRDDERRWWTAVALGRFRTPQGLGLSDADIDDALPLALVPPIASRFL